MSDLLDTMQAFIDRPPAGGVEIILQAARDEIVSLRRWKDEALPLLAAWTKVWEAAGRPGELGGSIVEATLLKVLEQFGIQTTSMVGQSYPGTPEGASAYEVVRLDHCWINSVYSAQDLIDRVRVIRDRLLVGEDISQSTILYLNALTAALIGPVLELETRKDGVRHRLAMIEQIDKNP